MPQIIKYKIFILACCLMNFAGSAQSIYDRTMQNIKAVSANSTARYCYKLTMLDTRSGKTIDSLSGKLYKDHAMYFDSSSLGINSVNKEYLCKVAFGSKEVTVYNLRQLKGKMKVKISQDPTMAFNIPDSLIRKHGKMTIDSSNAQQYRLVFVLKGQPVSKVTMVVSKINFSLTSIVFEIPQSDPTDHVHAYVKVMSIYDMQYDVDPQIFNLDHIFRIDGSKISLSDPYKKYKLQTLTN